MATTKAMHAEGLLRAACTVLSATAAILLGFSAQTKTVLFVEKKAVSKDVQVLWILTIVAGTGAGYHLLRLLKCFYLSRFPQNPCWKSRALAWACFLLDKGWTYVFFGSTIAALQACVVALNGVDALQWSKLCNIYTRFCDQVAAAILSCLLASAAMAVLSAFSARDLFRLYSSAIAGSAPSCNSE